MIPHYGHMSQQFLIDRQLVNFVAWAHLVPRYSTHLLIGFVLGTELTPEMRNVPNLEIQDAMERG